MISFFEKNGVHFVSYSEQFDTGTPVGKLMITLLASNAEFERETISDNVKTAFDIEQKRENPQQHKFWDIIEKMVFCILIIKKLYWSN